ncbi:putative membrane protein, partial [Yersinia pestis PY-66]
MVLTVAIS